MSCGPDSLAPHFGQVLTPSSLATGSPGATEAYNEAASCFRIFRKLFRLAVISETLVQESQLSCAPREDSRRESSSPAHPVPSFPRPAIYLA